MRFLYEGRMVVVLIQIYTLNPNFYAVSENLVANLITLALNKDLHACTIHDAG